MKPLLIFASGLAFATLLLPAQAQTPSSSRATTAPPKPTPQSPDQRAAAYKGPKVVKDTKALGKKMIRDSKPDTQPLGRTSPK